MKELLNFVRGKTFEQLKAQLSVDPYRVAAHHDGKLYTLYYDLIKSDMNLPIVQQSRGVILEVGEDEHKIVALPFTKFFNFEERQSAEIVKQLSEDWSGSVVTEKIDGSLVKMYWYNNSWRFGTMKMIDANKSYFLKPKNHYQDRNMPQGQQRSMQHLIEECLTTEQRTFIELHASKHHTYIFEMVHPESRVILDYGNTKKLFLTAVMNTLDFSEDDQEHHRASQYFDVPKVYHEFSSLDQLLQHTNTLGHEKEGFVVRDKLGRRIKVKSPDYVTLHKNIQFVTPADMVQWIWDKKSDDIVAKHPKLLPLFEQCSERLQEIETQVASLMKQVQTEYNNDRAKVGSALGKHKLKSIIFALMTDDKTFWQLDPKFVAKFI